VTISGSEQSDYVQDGTYCAQYGYIWVFEQWIYDCTDWEPNYVLAFDAGTVTVTVNGFSKFVSYGSSSTPTSIASGLASAFNGDGSSPVTASASAGVLSVTAKTTGSSSDYSLSASVSYDSGDFSSASFAATPSGSTLTGGSGTAGGFDAPLTTTYSYRATGELTGVSAGSQSRTYNYDDLGRTTSTVLPETGTTSYTYYDYGLVNTRTDARGVITSYTYTGLHEPYQVSYTVGSTGVSNPGTVTFTYGTSSSSNNKGRLTQMSDGTGSASYTYDVMGRVTGISKVISSTTYNTSYSYNGADETTGITYPSTLAVGQSYDAIGRLSQITNNSSNALNSFSYNDASQPLGFSYGNGVTGTLTYNDHLQVSTLKYMNGGTTLLDLTYGYGTGNNGQIQGITDASGTAKSTSYTYDELGRLSAASTGNLTSADTWALAWTYDRYGNRLSQAQTGGTLSGVYQPSLSVSAATNQISSGYSYDANGNLTNDALNTYVYDAENRLISMNGGAHTYAYDGNGLRVQKDSTVYIYSGAKVIAEYASGGSPTSPQKEYVYSGSGLLQTVVSSAVTYHHPDHLSTRVETNSGGTVTRTFGSLPFGDPWYETGTASKWKFTSYERDSESGLDYALMRYNSSRIGRFMTPDPAGLAAADLSNPQSLNGYAYVLNNPMNFIDPLGLSCSDPHDHKPCIVDVVAPGPVVAPGVPDSLTHDIYGGRPLLQDFPDSSSVTPASNGGGPANNGRKCTPTSASAGQYVAATAQAAAMTGEFFSGLGPDSQTFGVGSATSQVMAQSAGVQQALNEYYMLGRTSNLYEFGGPGAASAGANPVAQFVGSFRWSITPANGGINLSLTNTTSFRSLTFDKGPQWQRVSIPVSLPAGGMAFLATPMGNIHQTYKIFVPCK
jgi:RHS repeat-associated protein